MVYIYNFAIICLTVYLCINYSFWWLLLLLLTGGEDEK